MFQTARVKELASRKRLLVAESELNRQLLAVELMRLRPTMDQARNALNYGRALSPLLLTVGGIAAGLLLTKGDSLKSLLAKVLISWQLFKNLRPLWEQFRGGQDRATPTNQSDGEVDGPREESVEASEHN